MLTDTIIEDGQEVAVTREEAEHLARKRLLSQCPPCGGTIWHFRDEDTTFEEVHAELARLRDDNRTCSTCRHKAVRLGYGPCCGCVALDPSRPNWEPEDATSGVGGRDA